MTSQASSVLRGSSNSQLRWTDINDLLICCDACVCFAVFLVQSHVVVACLRTCIHMSRGELGTRFDSAACRQGGGEEARVQVGQSGNHGIVLALRGWQSDARSLGGIRTVRRQWERIWRGGQAKTRGRHKQMWQVRNKPRSQTPLEAREGRPMTQRQGGQPHGPEPEGLGTCYAVLCITSSATPFCSPQNMRKKPAASF